MSLLYIKKHSYLVKDICEIADFEPRVMIRAMDREMGFHTRYSQLEPPFLRLASSHPMIFSPNVEGVKEKIAFGRWALPRLRRQILSKDIFAVMRALNSIKDLVHDPEKAYEAIRIGMIDRLTPMMLHELAHIREKICLIFYTLGGLEAGRRAIIRRYKILKNLILLLEDEKPVVRHKAHRTLELICLSPMATTGLNCADFVVLILRLIGGKPKTEDQEETTALHLLTLSHFLKIDSKTVALDHNAMEILMEKANSENEDIQKHALACLASLCEIPRGRQEAIKLELPLLLCKILYTSTTSEVRAKVITAMTFLTIATKCRSQLAKRCVVDQVMQVLEYFHNSEGQIMATKLLSNLLESNKGYVLVKQMKQRIKSLFTRDPEVTRYQQQLLNLMKKKIDG